MSRFDGKIEFCPHQGCHYSCCDFAAGNYIVLHPGELAEAVKHGESLNHLTLKGDGIGGHRAICHAKDTSTCDRGYKPLDCSCYPFFPTLDSETGKLNAGLKGDKCPLQTYYLSEHRQKVLDCWRALLAVAPGLAEWIHQTVLVGYSFYRGDDSPPDEFHEIES